MGKDTIRFRCITENLLNDGISVRVSTRGPSMFPLISPGDKITIKPETDYQIGDLVVFKRDDQMVCHRLVKVFERDGIRYCQSRGDSFFVPDDPVAADQLLGKVINIERGKVSIARGALLFMYPVLRISVLNALIVNSLMRLKAMFTSVKKLF